MATSGIITHRRSSAVITIFAILAASGVGNLFGDLACAAEDNKQEAQSGASYVDLKEWVADMTKQIEGHEKNLRTWRERYGSDHPKIKEVERELGAARDMLDRALKAEEIASTAQPNAMLQAMREQLELTRAKLSQREQQLIELNEHLASAERDRATPPDEGNIKVFRLKYAPAKEAAKTVESLFGAQSLRVAIDERTNTLIVFGKPNWVETIEALLLNVDQQAASKEEIAPKSTKQEREERYSLLLRVFWLADGLPETTGQAPDEFLPASVLKATEKLGLVAPRLISQTVTSLAVGEQTPVPFSSNVPAIVDGQPLELSCEGTTKCDMHNHEAELQMAIRVGGTSVNVQGSLLTKLGHFMVLGTANSVMGGAAMAAAPGGFAPGMAEGSGFSGRGRFGPGAEGGGPEGAMPPDPNAVDPGSLTTSRFAFVVQVVEGESYSDESAGPPRDKKAATSETKGEQEAEGNEDNPFGG